MKKIKKIVTIGGGTGQFNLLSSLRDLAGIKISAVVSMVDSGGSTGRLRDELGILPPGDILKCILALSPNREQARKILQKRFETKNRLNGHSAGNMLLTILSQYAGNFPDGVKALGEILDIQGEVFPVTIDKATLAAELTDKSFLFGEAAIDVPRGDQREKIKRTFLIPHHNGVIKVYPPVVKAIEEADYIIIGPGDIYTSITPNFLVPGVAEAVQKSKGKLIYVTNIMTKFGETDNFKARDFILKTEKFIGRKMDKVLANSVCPTKKILDRYKAQKARCVKIDIKGNYGGREIIKKDLVDISGDIIRHNPEKLLKALKEIIV